MTGPRRLRERLAFAAALALLCTRAHAQGPFKLKPDAKGKVCLDCHVTFEETLAKKSVHTPVKGGECAECHNPHASRHGKLLAADPRAVCVQCHDGLVPAEARSEHRMVTEGECVACHDPHASDHESNLVRTDRELCLGCHTDLAQAAAAVQFKHSPVEKSCMTCHDPHASAKSDALLRKPLPELCVACHDPKVGSFSRQHQGYPVERARCTSCHDPHGSNNAGMLWATVHRPVVNKMCNQCHPDATAPDALQVKKSGAELCRGCHSSTLNEIDARERLHWPLADEVACRHCHSPHASREDALLPDTADVVCGECHADTIARQARSVTKHPPVLEGQCTACHSPHSSDNQFLLAGTGTIDVCATCHDWKGHSNHPIGAEVVDLRNPNLTLDCTSCHLTHGSEHEHLAPFDPRSGLCVDCHETFTR